MEKLREALEVLDGSSYGDAISREYIDPVVEAVCSVLDAPEAWWCEKHGLPEWKHQEHGNVEPLPPSHRSHCWIFHIDSNPTVCRLVRVRLVEVTE